MLCQRSFFQIFVACLLTSCLFLSCCGKKGSDEGAGGDGQSAEAAKSEQGSSSTPTDSDASTPASSSKPADGTAIAIKNIALVKQTSQSKTVESIPVDTLKSFLPATLAGMEQMNVDTDAMTVMGVKITETYADYGRVSGAGDMHLSITDVGNATGPISMVMTSWVTQEIDNKNDTEYEKTTTFQGYKALEEYNNEGPSGTFTILVANRFVVEVSGNRVAMDALKKAVTEVDLKGLAEAAK